MLLTLDPRTFPIELCNFPSTRTRYISHTPTTHTISCSRLFYSVFFSFFLFVFLLVSSISRERPPFPVSLADGLTTFSSPGFWMTVLTIGLKSHCHNTYLINQMEHNGFQSHSAKILYMHKRR